MSKDLRTLHHQILFGSTSRELDDSIYRSQEQVNILFNNECPASNSYDLTYLLPGTETTSTFILSFKEKTLLHKILQKNTEHVKDIEPSKIIDAWLNLINSTSTHKNTI
jgi:hypothetical protein